MMYGSITGAQNDYSYGTGSISTGIQSHIPSVPPGDFRHQYDHINHLFYFNVGYATIIVPMEIAHLGGTYEVQKERNRYKNMEAKVICENSPVDCDDCCTPDVAEKKEVENDAKPKIRKDLCSRFLYEK